MNESIPQSQRKNWMAFLAIALLLGAVLRLVFPGDIEYKGDERYMFDASQKVGVTQPWPGLGMTSGANINNPGMSVWVFVVLAKVTGASNPPGLARAVQLMNILGLLVLAFFALRLLPETQRLPWYWATAFAAVNPAAVLFQRKIWAQSTLPLLCILIWIAWYYRKTRFGAFCWGLLGACVGQIHMSGFYLAGGVLLWTLLHDRVAKWGAWFLGSILGALPLIPWLHYMATKPGNTAPFDWRYFWWLIYPKYWIYWVTDSLGLGLTHSLGSVPFKEFLRYPLIGGWPTYLVGVLHLVVLVSGILFLYSGFKTGEFLRGIRDRSETGLAVNSLLIAAGVLMALCGFRVFQHYLIMSFPLEWVWLARLNPGNSGKGGKFLAVLWAAQLLVSAAFLGYIHLNHGVPGSDYGTAYQYQSP